MAGKPEQALSGDSRASAEPHTFQISHYRLQAPSPGPAHASLSWIRPRRYDSTRSKPILPLAPALVEPKWPIQDSSAM
ncbi:hypothetical protein CSIM01_07936 [Colletotrichum simmondsii]|uniref:Uncharacterized protein n=2 Tax=Colletotrichum acutatum species complex TaxID=2707335 RepID=A0A135S5B1_9PEZI|nr:hypothetical protein CSIM01_07936 [Colletotrichum simmondsii]KXH55389.1 hypothetical protein CNYM01_11193 [Colletotrichum nymphaeae SA-01]